MTGSAYAGYSMGGTATLGYNVSSTATLAVGYDVTGKATLGFSCSAGTVTACLQMAAGTPVNWQAAGNVQTEWDSTANEWEFLYGSTVEDYFNANGNIGFAGHLVSTQGTGSTTTVVCRAAGTCTLSAYATDVKGTVTEGTSSTGFTLTFATAYANPPDCIISPDNGVLPQTVVAGRFNLVLTNSAATGDTFTYLCIQ